MTEPYPIIKARRGVCVVDSFLNESAKGLPTQGALLAEHLSREGMTVLKTSSRPGKVRRALDIAVTLVRRAPELDVALIQVFGRRAFHYTRLSSWVAKRMGKRVVFVLRGGTLPAELLEHPQRLRATLDRADILVAPSSYMAEVFRKAGFRVEIIPNFIEIERYPFRLCNAPQPRLFWVRAFHEQYNPKMAIKVLALLKEQHRDAVLSMGGPDRGELEDCKRLAAALGVEDSIRFLGLLTKEQIVVEAMRHDFHIHTNRIDNTPVTLIENMALGLPIVATKVGGVPHLVRDGETALLVNSEDAKGMADAITQLLTSPELAKGLSWEGRRLVENNFTWAAVRGAWLPILDGR